MTFEQKLFEKIKKIQPTDKTFFQKAKEKWNAIAKPLGALGILEDDICKIAAVQKTLFPKIDRRILAVFCADNGIVKEGVSQTDSSVTSLVARSICHKKSSVCIMAQKASCEILAVDCGILKEIGEPDILNIAVRRGTESFLEKNAIEREECAQTILRGIETAEKLKDEFDIFLSGEMGIGNTTTSAAVLSSLLNLPAEKTAGKGAGLSDSALLKKIAVINQGIKNRQPNPLDAIDVLSKVGGLDIAAMAGFFIGAALCEKCAVVDGLISACAAFAAAQICPTVRDFLLASHAGSEKAHRLVLEKLQIEPVIFANLHLGEGTGAVSLLPLLDMALAVFKNLHSFEQLGMEPYKKL